MASLGIWREVIKDWGTVKTFINYWLLSLWYVWPISGVLKANKKNQRYSGRKLAANPLNSNCFNFLISNVASHRVIVSHKLWLTIFSLPDTRTRARCFRTTQLRTCFIFGRLECERGKEEKRSLSKQECQVSATMPHDRHYPALVPGQDDALSKAFLEAFTVRQYTQWHRSMAKWLYQMVTKTQQSIKHCFQMKPFFWSLKKEIMCICWVAHISSNVY